MAAAEVHPDIPYRYQEEVFLRAQKENIIAALNTGSGKTLISILLIKWIAAQERSKGKAIIFLVPKVTLVDQQRGNIKKQTSLKVAKLHGAMELSMSDRAGWGKKFKNYDVFVMTAQIFLNLITHGLWRINQVSLMIFDECHHARRNHPYNGILREYFQVAPSQRPKIFGMTASPIWNVQNPLNSIQVLEQNMDAKVVGVRENVAELLEKSPKPEERIVQYPYPLEAYDKYPSPDLYQCLKVVDQSVWGELGISFDTIETRYDTTFYNLGPYCASLSLFLEMQRLTEAILLEAKQSAYHSVSPDDMDDIVPGSSISRPLPDDIHLILDILHGFASFFPPHMSSQDIPIPISLDWCTPKVKILADILLEFYEKSPNFQCIIFVEQRQICSALSKLLPVIPELKGKVKTAFLVGQGVNGDGVSKQTDRYHGDAVGQFRDSKINILIATSVAEEGLDFKECDLVVRFDDLDHMIAYVQSRGRARRKSSTFVLMVQQGNHAQLQKYLNLKDKEDEVSQVYRDRHQPSVDIDDTDDDDLADEEYSADLVDRERYVVKSTGAILTYDNSLQLLSNLCSLIPRDAFTAVHKPRFTGDFEATLHLPRALPLSSKDLVFVGPPKRSKKEARRAVAFMAVQRLRELDVFDEYLLPASNESQEKDKPLLRHVAGNKERREVPEIMTVPVRDPWCMGQELWLHPLEIDGRVAAGLVTGTILPPTEVVVSSSRVCILPAEKLTLEETMEVEQRRAMEEYTKLGIFFNNSGKPLSGPPSLYLVPITAEYVPDFTAIHVLLDNPRGIRDWSRVSEAEYDKIMVTYSYRFGRMLLLRRIRQDLTPLSIPPPGSREASSPTYHEHWVKKWSKNNRQAIVPTDGPILETVLFPKSDMGLNTVASSEEDLLSVDTVPDGRLIPQNISAWFPIHYSVLLAYKALPMLCQRITTLFRARSARYELKLPSIPDNHLIEVFTLPAAGLSFSNQRLETLGDAVLQVCTTVHLLNQYPTRHEGQLTRLRQKTVSNWYLMQHALDVGLERYVNCETQSVHKWRYVLSSGEPSNAENDNDQPVRYVERVYPRRSLQDCMEAILGASYLSGGMSMALQTGTALGLEFGGPSPWFMRYPQTTDPGGVSPLFAALEDQLGYEFRHNHLLLEALTHPSFATATEGPSYQRLEFLGDAILDLVVAGYLFNKFSEATSHQLSHCRQKVICASTLANIAVRRLGLHKMMLINSLDLTSAISHYVPILENLSGEEIVQQGWRYDPPKALSDVFESVMGAVLVDSGYDYEKTAAVMEYVMDDVLEVLSPDIGKNPVSQLVEWAASKGCTNVILEKRTKKMAISGEEREGVVVLVHGTVIVGPIVATSNQVARFDSSERALAILKNQESDNTLQILCTCRTAMPVDGLSISDSQSSDDKDAAEVVNQLVQDQETSLEF